jgi:alkanesulfonate monooxygenase SsuD/methylene tetrahydromethanopterin reductase-like flavin-dependent oxidoreductase (luciferase family)
VTERVELAPLVTCTGYRNPALLAKIADTVDEISGGRLILALGAGWHEPEYRAFGFPYDHRVGRFEEALAIIVPLLREGRVDFQGQYYQVRDCVLEPRGPRAGGPPILIGAQRPR